MILRPNQLTWVLNPFVGCYCLHPPLSIIIITWPTWKLSERLVSIMDVTKFEFEFVNVWTLNFFQQMRSSTNVLSTLLSNANLWKNRCSMTDFTLYTQTAREHGQTFFLEFNLSHKLQLLNVQHNFCSVMCYTVLKWTQTLLSLGNNTVTLLFNDLNKCITFPLIKWMHLPGIRIHIRIRRMRILTASSHH